MNEDELDLTQEKLDEHLAHYGVPGQKWGVRRSSRQLARSNKGITKYREKAKTLTDAELNTRIKRLETEKKYRDLNKKTVGAGQKHINEVLVHIGKESAKKVGTNLTVHAVKKGLAKGTKIDMAAAFPKK